MYSKDDSDGRPATPSKSEVIAFVKREHALGEKSGAAPAKIGKREIARAFGVRGADRIALKRLLKELENEGVLERRGKRVHSAGSLPMVVLGDIVERDRDGDLIAAPVEWDEEGCGPAPRIRIESARSGRGRREPAPGVGDRALLRVRALERAEPGEPPFAGRVIKLIDRRKTRALGIFRREANGGGRVLPVDKKSLGREVWIAPGSDLAAEDGDLVAVEMGSGPRATSSARVAQRLGSVRSEAAVGLIALRRHGAPDEFGDAALAEAASAHPADLQGREDWRSLPLVTIDPPDARDHDDAVHATPDPDPANQGGYLLTVAIADVAAYVRPGGALDREALERGNSIYLPGRVIPMLPERISNDLCSLRAGEDRPALAARMTIDREGRKLRHSFHRVMIRSVAKLSYQQSQGAIDGAPDEITAPILESALRPLWGAYLCLRAARERRSPLDLEIPERKILLRDDGSIDRVIVPPRLEAHRLIEEFMILANVAAAESLEDRRHPQIYRVHDEPTFEKVNELSEFLASLGIKLAKGQALRPSHFNAILHRVRGGDNEALVNESVLRAQAQAEYAHQNYGHFGLNLRRYAHFTSPIRRYADLIVHRALIRALGLGKDGLKDSEANELEEIAARISAAERRAVMIERETTDRLIASWLADKIGARFEGRISGVVKAGLFVKLTETGADGFVPAATLGTDYFRYNESRRSLVGDRTRKTFRLGDVVAVTLVEAAPFAGALRFEIVADQEGSSRPARAVLARDRKSSGGKDRSHAIDGKRKRHTR